jgi:hypothetical protein
MEALWRRCIWTNTGFEPVKLLKNQEAGVCFGELSAVGESVKSGSMYRYRRKNMVKCTVRGRPLSEGAPARELHRGWYATTKISSPRARAFSGACAGGAVWREEKRRD